MTPRHVAFTSFDVRLTRWTARHAVTLLRVSVGICYLWFGILKFFPGASPAQDLAARTIAALTFGLVGPSVSVPALALVETGIGLALIGGWWLRGTLAVMLGQMIGTITPLVLFPHETFLAFPFAPTLEGQYIIKNVVLIGAAMVVGSTVRGGGIVVEPTAQRPMTEE